MIYYCLIEKEIGDRLSIAGIEIIETRIFNPSYTPERKAIMLQRQQAQAIIGAIRTYYGC